MPARPSYFHRVEEALEVFRSLAGDWIDRRTIEQTFGVSKTVAWRIMRSSGAIPGPGNTLVCARGGLLASLEHLQKTGHYEHEVLRRERLENRLSGLLAAARSKHLRVATEDRAITLLSTRFAKLPPGMELTHKRLTVEFSGMADFLEKVGALVYALHNDYESVAGFLESDSK